MPKFGKKLSSRKPRSFRLDEISPSQGRAAAPKRRLEGHVTDAFRDSDQADALGRVPLPKICTNVIDGYWPGFRRSLAVRRVQRMKATKTRTMIPNLTNPFKKGVSSHVVTDFRKSQLT